MTSRINKKLINQSEVARQLGCSQAYVNMIMNGLRTGKKAQEKRKQIQMLIKQQSIAA